MIKRLCCAAISALFIFQLGYAQTPGKINGTDQVLLPNGWKLSPAGHGSIPLGDLPLNIQISSSGKLMAVTNNGQSTQSVQLIDARNQKLLDTRVIDKSWYGIAFSNDEHTLYASGGNNNCIVVYPVSDNKFGKADTIRLGVPWPKKKICTTGIVVTRDNKTLYTVTKEDNTLYTIDPASKTILSRTPLAAEAYSCLLSPDEKTLYISLWGGEGVALYNTATKKITGTIHIGNHPNELLLNKKGTLLFAANANDNSVSIINTVTNKVIETVSTALYPTKLTGSTTNGLALSPNEKNALHCQCR